MSVDSPKGERAAATVKRKTSKKIKTNQIVLAVKPITCYEDLIKLPEIPTKLYNLKLPEKNKPVAPSSRSASSSLSNPDPSSTGSAARRFPGRYIPSDYDVIVDKSTFLSAPTSQFFKQMVQQFAPVFFVDPNKAVNRVLAEVAKAGGHFLQPTATHWIECDGRASEAFTKAFFEQHCLPRPTSTSLKLAPTKASIFSAKFAKPAAQDFSDATQQQTPQVSLEGTSALDLLSAVALSDLKGGADNGDDYYNSKGLKNIQ